MPDELPSACLSSILFAQIAVMQLARRHVRVGRGQVVKSSCLEHAGLLPAPHGARRVDLFAHQHTKSVREGIIHAYGILCPARRRREGARRDQVHRCVTKT
jgi:hypothetical protein